MATREDLNRDDPGTYDGNGPAYEASHVGASGPYGRRTGRTGRGDTSIGTLIGSLLSDTNRLIKDEIRLAKAEAAQKVGQAKSGAVSIVIGGALVLLGLIYVILAAIYALDNVLPDWAAALIVGGVIAIAGYVFIKKGERDLSTNKLAPTRTQENIHRDAQTFKESV